MSRSLNVAPCSREAAKYAVEHWHYSHVMPAGRLVTIGAWENDDFIGTVVFSRGATHALAQQWGYTITEAVELTRVALRDHNAPVSQIVAHALRILRRTNPGLQLVISFADPNHGHHGGIYQAGNWYYTGRNNGSTEFIVHGTQYHARSIHAKGWKQTVDWLQQHVDPKARTIRVSGKHRYLMPLTRAARRRITPHAKPYPAPETALSSTTPE